MTRHSPAGIAPHPRRRKAPPWASKRFTPADTVFSRLWERAQLAQGGRRATARWVPSSRKAGTLRHSGDSDGRTVRVVGTPLPYSFFVCENANFAKMGEVFTFFAQRAHTKCVSGDRRPKGLHEVFTRFSQVFTRCSQNEFVML